MVDKGICRVKARTHHAALLKGRKKVGKNYTVGYVGTKSQKKKGMKTWLVVAHRRMK